MVWFLFYNLLKFDVINAEAKLNKARRAFSNEVSLNVGADFQLLPSKDARKRTKNVHPYFIEKKMKNVS